MKKRKRIIILCAAALLLIGTYLFFYGHKPGALKVPILMYHSVTAEETKAGRYTVTAEEFESDMRWLSDHGYHTVFISDLENYVRSGTPLPDKPVCVTLDDGYEDNLTLVLPILQKLDMKATVSVVGNFSSDKSAGRTHLDWDDIRQMAASGNIEIGNHTYAMHYNSSSGRRGCKQMAGESDGKYIAALESDLEKLQGELAEKSGVTPTVFTYPYGKISPLSETAVKTAGFGAALTTRPGMCWLSGDEEELYHLPRFIRPSGIATSLFMLRLGI